MKNGIIATVILVVAALSVLLVRTDPVQKAIGSMSNTRYVDIEWEGNTNNGAILTFRGFYVYGATVTPIPIEEANRLAFVKEPKARVKITKRQTWYLTATSYCGILPVISTNSDGSYIVGNTPTEYVESEPANEVPVPPLDL
jgi:hypothetical protein